AEMLALAQEAVRSKDPVNHYVLSWQEGEQPTPAQVEDAVTIFLDELGLQDHQAIYGLHADTDNLHLHLVVNRVNPDSLKVIKPNRGFDIEAAHKAVARIEKAQGWEREQHGRYQVQEDGTVSKAQRDPDKPRPRQPAQPKRDQEHRTGEKSAERVGIEQAGPIIKQAKTWQELHRELAAVGIQYERTGSGAVLKVGDVNVKASSADRAASLGQLQKRLGIYEPAAERQQIAERRPEPVRQTPGWETYNAGRKAQAAAKAAAVLAQQKQQQDERKALVVEQKARRATVLQGSWKGKGELRNALASVLAAEQAAQTAALVERHGRERGELREDFPPWPSLADWQRQQTNPDAKTPRRTLAVVKGDKTEPPTPRDIRSFKPEIHGEQVHYTRKEGPRAVDAAFIDKGARIAIQDLQRDSVLAALQLSAAKWDSFTVNGSAEYKAIAVSLAAEHGFRIENPELRDAIVQARAERPAQAAA
ncbi:relaxase/mobilization nuclease domain-containing protein, partial [bacterium]|nr:relaxase/mobilization nuclease domain-containing protein [bacterium]